MPKNTNAIKTLHREYSRKKSLIRQRLQEFREIRKDPDGVFRELCFCLLTPQSKAVNCDRAIRELAGCGMLRAGCARAIARTLRKHVRFHNNKASYLVAARQTANAGPGSDLKRLLASSDHVQAREWLVKNIKGLGYKEASHFLRNIGLGRDIAILDRHILKNLKRYGVIGRIPKSLTRKQYLAVEQKMLGFCKKIGMSADELDLLFWSQETGVVFK